MKRILVLLLVIIGTGCATKVERAQSDIARTWQIDQVFEDGQEITASYTSSRLNYRITFTNNSTFTETYYPFSGSNLVTVEGTWVFSDGISKITLTDGNQVRVFQIDQLEDDHFNITNLANNDNTELHLVPE